MAARILPTENRVLVKVIEQNKEKIGMLYVPTTAQEKEPKVFEADVLALGPWIERDKTDLKVGDRVLIPGRILSDRLTDGTIFVRYTEIFGHVEQARIQTGGIAEAVKKLVEP